ncbi:MAG TPA: hypothetical protein VNE86_07595 [Nitrososphaerales archaeon]|nr:hypothetical protein [Nitrososphaerales archaeon]
MAKLTLDEWVSVRIERGSTGGFVSFRSGIVVLLGGSTMLIFSVAGLSAEPQLLQNLADGFDIFAPHIEQNRGDGCLGGIFVRQYLQNKEPSVVSLPQATHRDIGSD